MTNESTGGSFHRYAASSFFTGPPQSESIPIPAFEGLEVECNQWEEMVECGGFKIILQNFIDDTHLSESELLLWEEEEKKITKREDVWEEVLLTFANSLSLSKLYLCGEGMNILTIFMIYI